MITLHNAIIHTTFTDQQTKTGFPNANDTIKIWGGISKNGLNICNRSLEIFVSENRCQDSLGLYILGIVFTIFFM